VSVTAYERCTCPDEEHCGLRMLMLDVRNAIANILDRYSLAQVVEVTLRKLRRDNVAPSFAEALKGLAAEQAPPAAPKKITLQSKSKPKKAIQ
jgi:hypothetical protein